MAIEQRLAYPHEMLDELFKPAAARPPQTEGDKDAWRQVIDAVFFASLHTEESAPVRVSVVWMAAGVRALATVTAGPFGEGDPHRLAWEVVPFERPRALSPNELRKLSKGLEHGGQFVVAAGTSPNLKIDGVAMLRPGSNGGALPLRVHAVGPGHLVFEEAWGETCAMDRGQLIRRGTKLDAIPEIRHRMEEILGVPSGTSVQGPFLSGVPMLLQRMRRTGSGAILGLCSEAPAEGDPAADFYRLSEPGILKESILKAGAAKSAWTALDGEALKSNAGGPAALAESRRARFRFEDSVTELLRAFDLVGRLSAIDGAVLVGPQLQVYGAGYIIGAGTEPRLSITDGENGEPPGRFGARHDAACRFVETRPRGLAFVISEDGPVRCAVNAGGEVHLWRGWMPQLERYSTWQTG